MKGPVRCSLILSVFSLLGPVKPGMGVPTVVVGTHHLEPDTPDQVVEIHVSGGDAVQGLNLYVMVANGGPELELIEGGLPPGTGIPGPAITYVDTITDTIFASNNTGQVIVPDGDIEVPQVETAYAVTASGTVPAEGLLARITLDTTGFFEGTYALSLSALGHPSDFAGIPIDITDGLIVIDSADPPVDPPAAPPAANQPPTVDAGLDQTVEGATVVQLAGSGSDPEGMPVTYRWRQTDGPPVVLGDPASAVATFTAPSNNINTILAFEFSVSDDVNTATDTVTVTVNVNQALFSVDAGPDQTVEAGATVQLNATVSNIDPQLISFGWIQVGGPTVAIAGGSTAAASFTAPVEVSNTQLTFEVLAFDGVYEAADTVTIQVNANTTHPTADAGEDQAVAAGATVQLNGSGTDPAGLGLTFLWVQIDGPEVQLSSETIADPTFVAPSLSEPSRVEFELHISSGGLTSIDTVRIHVAAAPLAVAAPPDPSGGSEEEIDLSSPLPLPQPVSQETSWATSAAMAVGIALLILALLLLWLFWL